MSANNPTRHRYNICRAETARLRVYYEESSRNCHLHPPLSRAHKGHFFTALFLRIILSVAFMPYAEDRQRLIALCKWVVVNKRASCGLAPLIL